MGWQEWIINMLAAGGGGAVVAYCLFKYLGGEWIKHQLAKDLESAKAEISLLSTRRMKLHEKEYEVFPEMWARLMRASHSLQACVLSMNTMPDFSRMTPDKIGHWIERSELDNDERDYFIGETDKSKAYSRILDSRKINAAGKCSNEFWQYLHDNRIFLSPDVKEKFDQIETKMRSSWVARKIDFDYPGTKDLLLKAYDICEKEVKPLTAELEILVQSKLFPEK